MSSKYCYVFKTDISPLQGVLMEPLGETGYLIDIDNLDYPGYLIDIDNLDEMRLKSEISSW